MVVLLLGHLEEETCCPDEAVERRSSLATGISSHEEVILSANRDGPLGRAVVYLQQA
jgi:hypothetical protein